MNKNYPRRSMIVQWILILALTLILAPATARAFDIVIEISPDVLNIQSNGSVVTIHTDIDYGIVDVYTVYLNSIPIQSWKVDNRGNFVAKFSMDEVKMLDGLAIDAYNTLKMVGLTINGEPFVGQQDIRVIDIVPQGR